MSHNVPCGLTEVLPKLLFPTETFHAKNIFLKNILIYICYKLAAVASCFHHDQKDADWLVYPNTFTYSIYSKNQAEMWERQKKGKFNQNMLYFILSSSLIN